MRQVFGSAPLVQIGKRSYGLYLWHWPVFVLTRAATGPGRLAAAVVITVILSEACYRFVEERRCAKVRCAGGSRPARRPSAATDGG